jgi:hypothetical protein
MLQFVKRSQISRSSLTHFWSMMNPNRPEPSLLKTVLEPLLEDFQYWFDRSRTLLESEEMSFLETQEQADLLARVVQAQQEVSTAQTLLKVTEGKAGIQMEVLMPWHKLLTECWQVSMRNRANKAQP